MISERLIGWFKRIAAAALDAWRRKRDRRLLAGLSDWQLADAGIDPSEAGRGRAVAARRNPNLESMR
jgi:uncharacterized protein YjiS (DUF1127 family)